MLRGATERAGTVKPWLTGLGQVQPNTSALALEGSSSYGALHFLPTRGSFFGASSLPLSAAATVGAGAVLLPTGAGVE
jgi:hypothetical protein